MEPRPASLQRLFGFSTVVDRRFYAGWGFGLTAFKYAADALIVWLVAHVFWSPLDYVNPLFSARQQALGDISGWFQVAMACWSLPFLWIGVSMTARRALDAGLSPWFAVLFLVPLVNYLVMLLLCCLPGDPRGPASRTDSSPEGRGLLDQRWLAVVVFALLAVAGVFVAGGLLQSYSLSLFFLLPFLVGAGSGFVHNRRGLLPLSSTLGWTMASLLLAGCLLLGFALEGVLCLAMAFPAIAATAVLGAIFGRTVAAMSQAARGSAAGLAPFSISLLLVPVWAWVEARFEPAAAFEVESAIVVEADSTAVWPRVIAFSELDEPDWPLFRLGIAYPVRATIEGEGVGAVRRCEFSTGPFVEPITAWEPPRAPGGPGRLAFDVAAHPAPMHEWSPYRNLTPPHLAESFRSVRGEFRLVPLAGGRTRLEGSTWYELRLRPTGYWRVWSDLLVHRIHRRVLERIRAEAEA